MLRFSAVFNEIVQNMMTVRILLKNIVSVIEDVM